MQPKYISFITRLPCPECGAPLFSSGSEVWCSRQGSAEKTGCSYGVLHPITLRQYLDTMNRQRFAQVGAGITAHATPIHEEDTHAATPEHERTPHPHRRGE